jgi:hypothetical protein
MKAKMNWMNSIDLAIRETMDCDVSRLAVINGVEDRAGVRVKKEGLNEEFTTSQHHNITTSQHHNITTSQKHKPQNTNKQNKTKKQKNTRS